MNPQNRFEPNTCHTSHNRPITRPNAACWQSVGDREQLAPYGGRSQCVPTKPRAAVMVARDEYCSLRLPCRNQPESGAWSGVETSERVAGPRRPVRLGSSDPARTAAKGLPMTKTEEACRSLSDSRALQCPCQGGSACPQVHHGPTVRSGLSSRPPSTCLRTVVGTKSQVRRRLAPINRTRTRDAEIDRLLAEAGWLVVRAWEHEDPRVVADRIAEQVRRRFPTPRVSQQSAGTTTGACEEPAGQVAEAASVPGSRS
jgi:hypothetical protein